MLKILLLILSFLFMLLMNGLANGLPLNGKTTGQLSDQYPNLFVPAGITFSIWGIIYLLLLIFIIQKGVEILKNRNSTISFLVILNFILNGLWIVSWHYEFLIVSLLIMFSLLGTLALFNYSLYLKKGSFIEKAAFGIYFGWICVATIANFTAVLVHFKWSAFGISESIWTMLMIIVGAMIGSFATYTLRNPYIALVIIWAFFGIYLKRSTDEIPILDIFYSIYFGTALLFSIFVLTIKKLIFKNEKLTF